MTCCCVRTNIAWTALCSAVILIWFVTTHEDQTITAQEKSHLSTAGTVALLQLNMPGEKQPTRSNTAIVVSLASAAASLCAAILATLSARSAAYNDYQKLLIEWNKECIKEPFLTAVNDDIRKEFESNNSTAFTKFQNEGGERKMSNFSYMQLNTFEIVFEFEKRMPGQIVAFVLCILCRTNHQHEAWMSYFRYQVKKSSVMRGLIARDDLEEYYTKRFARFAKSVLETHNAGEETKNN
jgi:hypothetical protein